MPQGHLVFRAGKAMAWSGDAAITLSGQAGHGAEPQLAGCPVVAAAAAARVMKVRQTVVSRNTDPQQTTALVQAQAAGLESVLSVPDPAHRPH